LITLTCDGEFDGGLEDLVELKGLPNEIGTPDTLLADTGYFSEPSVAACEAAGIEPMIARAPSASWFAATGPGPSQTFKHKNIAEAPTATDEDAELGGSGADRQRHCRISKWLTPSRL
jgi:hypothetical protein